MAPEAERPSLTVSEAMQLGLQHCQAGRLPEAERILRGILAVEPDHADALNLLGFIAHQVGKNEISVELFSKAVRHQPSNPYYLNNLGNVLRQLKRYEEALHYYDQALANKPDYATALYNRGIVLNELQRYEEALSSNDDALKIKPAYAEAMSNRGNSLQALKRFDEALASYDRALSIAPDLAMAHYNESLCRLLLGDYERGWQKYEWRWKQFPAGLRSFPQPLWLGEEDIAGKSILLHGEQGLGDTIQFSRYVKEVAGRGAIAILQVPSVLKPLLSGIPGAHRVLGQDEPAGEFDFHCPLLSLPLAFNTRLDTVPAFVPYLSVRADSVSRWREELAGDGKRLVGLCWKGKSTYVRDGERSLRLAELGSLLACRNVRFVSLQKVLDEEERVLIEGMPNFVHPGVGFQDTAEMIGALDLVISVDTAWAHWAGAIGKPLWVLLPFFPHWPWLLDRDDSPWYPTARLFRQPRRSDWSEVVARVAAEVSRISPAS